MNWAGILVGGATFALIGSFHIVVIKGEYYFGKKIWPVFAAVGVLSLMMSLLITHPVASILVAVFGITCLWSVKELFEQAERVKKGWFPKNPKRK